MVESSKKLSKGSWSKFEDMSYSDDNHIDKKTIDKGHGMKLADIKVVAENGGYNVIKESKDKDGKYTLLAYKKAPGTTKCVKDSKKNCHLYM